ncbi:MAG: hypothetical protein KA275_04645 [Chitinophagaceae bacterium]|nr:hypothetical protein [Chitinophagaceae bacterium]
METSLKLIKQKLKNIIERLEWNERNMNDGMNFSLSGLSNIRSAIYDFKKLNLFTSLIDSLESSAIYTTAYDTMNIKIQEAREIVATLNLLKTTSTNFLEVLKSTIPEEDVNSINIKLPHVDDFDELSKVSKEIHLGLTQVILNKEINGETKIVSVENGSIWFNVFVGASAVTLIASLTWASTVIYKKIQEGKLLSEQVRGLKVKNDSLEDILKAQKKETDIMIQAEAEFIASEFFKKKEPENIERIKKSISTFAELIAKGAEIHPSLVAPENVSNLFPDPTKLIGLESKIKKLANPAEN